MCQNCVLDTSNSLGHWILSHPMCLTKLCMYNRTSKIHSSIDFVINILMVVVAMVVVVVVAVVVYRVQRCVHEILAKVTQLAKFTAPIKVLKT